MKRLVMALIVAAAVTGCAGPAQESPSGGGDLGGGSEVREKGSYKPTAQECEIGKEWWRESGPPKRGGRITGGSQSGAAHLDFTQPGLVAPVGGAYETLFSLRGCWSSDLAAGVPGLATSWSVTPDGLTWTVPLRQDARWQDLPPVNGRPFTSADVVWMVGHQQRGGILRVYWADVGVEALDAHTVVFRTKAPDADFLSKLSEARNAMAPREVFEQDGDFKKTQIGTGHFILKQFTASREFSEERNPNYYRMGVDGQPLPYVDSAYTVMFQDKAAVIAAWASGQLDEGGGTGLKRSDADQVRRAQPKVRVMPAPAPSSSNLWVNLRQEPWSNPKVREALWLAVDREGLIEYEDGGTYGGFIPVYMGDWAWSEDKLKQAVGQYDPQRAARLLEEAGFPKGSIKTVLETNQSWAEPAELVAGNLREAGIEAQVNVNQGQFTPVIQRGNYSLGWGRLGAQVYPTAWVDIYHSSSSFVNFGLRDSTVDSLVEAYRRELDRTKRLQIGDRLQERLIELKPTIIGMTPVNPYLESCRARNTPLGRASSYRDIRSEAWLDPTGC